MVFNSEKEFEETLIKVLINKAWEPETIKYPTEEELIQNWADILYENNKDIDRLNGQKLTKTEMDQILVQIRELRTPLKLNEFINGKSVLIDRDNPNDTLHYGRTVALKIYDRQEIVSGECRYQIVEQPIFKSASPILNDRRGDLMLLINGMPVIHIELKKTGVDVSEAVYQIKKYSHEGVFTGIFSLIQVFVAMTPTETLYFSNPGPDGIFNKDFYFHWENHNNEIINDWKQVTEDLLNIPMAHELIGYFTVPDSTDGILKVMRSYQIFAARDIYGKVVSRKDWNTNDQYGGYIWHTTGAGKTMTSFKSAQLIASSNSADKVVFLMDRNELWTQSLIEYKGFSNPDEDIQETEDTNILRGKLKSDKPSDKLIVTSIQKMSNLKLDDITIKKDIEFISKKRLVFIIDECHRSVFGQMLITIKESFPNALFFGFSGTPILEPNERRDMITSMIFGKELHRYVLSDGIRDKNVLGFDIYPVSTYRDRDLRKAVALQESKSKTEEEAISDVNKANIYYKFMNDVPMCAELSEDGNVIKGIEDYIPNSQYRTKEHQNKVVDDIINNWITYSRNSEFHAIFTVNSIPEAIDYYRIFKSKNTAIKVTCLFDPNIENTEGFEYKEDGLVEIIKDYNERYNQNFSLRNYDKLKKDMTLRLAHKDQYKKISKDEQIDLIIVVKQLLTGFDSKWINTLYLDRLLHNEEIIQAFSRTNRLYGPSKPFGIIRYYRKPNTMKKLIDKAVEMYSGDKPEGLFVDKLEENIEKMNMYSKEIREIFEAENIDNFKELPNDKAAIQKFSSLFAKFNKHLNAARLQGFKWDKGPTKVDDLEDISSEIRDFSRDDEEVVVLSERMELNIDVDEYSALVERQKELEHKKETNPDAVPYDIESYLTELGKETVDYDYMNSRFDKYYRALNQENISEEELDSLLNNLHKSFAKLSQEEQKYANVFLNDIKNGNIQVQNGKTFRDYITDYVFNAHNDEINKITNYFELDGTLLREMKDLNINVSNIDEYGRFTKLKESVNFEKVKKMFPDEPDFIIKMKIDSILREYIINNNLTIKLDDEEVI